MFLLRNMYIIHILIFVCSLNVSESKPKPKPRVFLMNKHGNKTVGEVLANKPVQVTQTTRQVTESTHQVTESTRQVTESTHQVTKSTTEVTTSTHVLTKSLHDFTKSTHEATKSTHAVTKKPLETGSKVPKKVKSCSEPEPHIMLLPESVKFKSNFNPQIVARPSKLKITPTLAKKKMDIEYNKEMENGAKTKPNEYIEKEITLLLIPRVMSQQESEEKAIPPPKNNIKPSVGNKNKKMPLEHQKMLLSLIRSPLNRKQFWMSNNQQVEKDREMKQRQKEMQDQVIQRHFINNLQHKLMQRMIPLTLGFASHMGNPLQMMRDIQEMLVGTVKEELMERQRQKRREQERLKQQRLEKLKKLIEQEKKRREEEKKKMAMRRMFEMLGFMGIPSMPEMFPCAHSPDKKKSEETKIEPKESGYFRKLFFIG